VFCFLVFFFWFFFFFEIFCIEKIQSLFVFCLLIHLAIFFIYTLVYSFLYLFFFFVYLFFCARPKPLLLRSVSLTSNPMATAWATAAAGPDVVVTSDMSSSDPLPASWALERQQLKAQLEQNQAMLQQNQVMLQQKDSIFQQNQAMLQQKDSIIQHLQAQLHATDQSGSAWDMRPV
jgi:hypothetical protein